MTPYMEQKRNIASDSVEAIVSLKPLLSYDEVRAVGGSA
jgi:hypothetical protein